MTGSKRALGRYLMAASVAAALIVVAPAARATAEPAASAPRAIFHHVHQIASDPAAANDWYLKHFGGTPTKVGPFPAVAYGDTNFLFFKGKEGFAGSVGSSVDHTGFSCKDIEAKMKELADAGVEIVSGIEQEGPIKFAFVKDPWGTTIEILEDPEIVGFHHIHLATTDPQATLNWYVNAFGGEISKFAGIVPGIRYGDAWVLVKKVSGQPAPTKGRSIDHVSWGFLDLDAAAVDLKAKGVRFASEPIAFGGGKIAFIEGPDGVRIELVGPGPKPAEKQESKQGSNSN